MDSANCTAARPSIADVALAVEASRFLVQHLPANREAMKITLVDEKDGTSTVDIPTMAMRHLVEILRHMSRGESVTLFPIHAELSTQEAADLLNVSRPHLVKLLDDGTIPHHKTGSHRRVRIEDLVDYMNRLGGRRTAALNALVSQGQSLDPDY